MSASNIDFNQYVTLWKPSSSATSYNASSYGVTKSFSFDTKSLHSAALSASSANSQKQTFTTCEDDFYITPVEDWVSGEGLTIKEIKKPKVNPSTPNNEPKVGSSTLPPPSRGAVCGTSTGVANLNLSFNCNFVASINLDSCLFKFKKTIAIYTRRLAKYAWSLIKIMFPFLDYTTKLAENICKLITQIQKIICFIQQIIACIMSTIAAIIKIITWVMSLPIRFIQSLISCISNLFSNIAGSFTSLMNILTSVFSSLFDCKPFNCPPINDINDLTDISGTFSAF